MREAMELNTRLGMGHESCRTRGQSFWPNYYPRPEADHALKRLALCAELKEKQDRKQRVQGQIQKGERLSEQD